MGFGIEELAWFAVGVALGAGVAALVVYSSSKRRKVYAIRHPRVPEGVDQMLEALDGAGIVVDPSGNIVKASRGAIYLGLVRAGRLADAELDELAIEVRETGETQVLDIDARRNRFGSLPRPLRVRATMLGERFILLIAEDRTEAVRLEEVRRDFIANISHELKTPIGAVGLLAEAIEPAADDPAQVIRFSTRMKQEAARLAQITNDIINLSRLQATEASHSPEVVDIHRIVQSALEHNRVAAEANQIELVSRGAHSAFVLGDEVMLEMAVKNLISNAIHYSPEGGRVGVGITVIDGAVEIAVTDQGIGIPEEDRGRVFERFFRVDPSRARNTGGTGLGLSIVKHTVQNHGGEVKLWSQLGKGSTFMIRLPQADDQPA